MKLHTVLRPPENIDRAAIKFAQAHFADNHMGFCLGSDSHLPHITIIQTEIENDTNMQSLHDAIMALDWNVETTLELGDYYHRTDNPYNGVPIINAPSLQTLHDQAVKIHRDMGASVLNAHGDGFWPHMTFALTMKKLPHSIELPPELIDVSSGWTLDFGHTGDHGSYLGKQKPMPL